MGSSFLDVDSQRLLNFFRKIKMRDDVIIHSVLFLALMASIGHTHSQEHEAPKTGGHTYPSTNYRSYYPAPKYGGGYMPQYGGGYQPPSYGGGYGYPKPMPYGYNTGYGYGKPTYGDYPTPEPEGEVEPAEPPVEFDYNAYTTAYFNKINEYTHAQNDYKTDTLNVKVNWDLQPAGYQYLKSQYGIYPQVHRPLRPYGGYPRYGGYSYGGYQPPKYGGYQKPQYGYKKPHHGGHAEPEAAPAPEPHADHEGHVEGHQWAEE